MNGQPATATFAEFASISGFKRSYITQLRHAGRLVLDSTSKRVRVAESLALIEATSDPSKRGVAARHAKARAEAAAAAQAPAAPAPEPPAASDDPEGEDRPFHSNRAEREKWAARSARLEYERAVGKLVDRKEVEAAVATAGMTIRKALERLRDVLPPQLAHLTDESAIRSALDQEFEHALGELSRQFANVAKEVAA